MQPRRGGRVAGISQRQIQEVVRPPARPRTVGQHRGLSQILAAEAGTETAASQPQLPAEEREATMLPEIRRRPRRPRRPRPVLVQYQTTKERRAVAIAEKGQWRLPNPRNPQLKPNRSKNGNI